MLNKTAPVVTAPVIKTERYSNWDIKRETHLLNGELHNEDGPADIEFYKGGSVRRETHALNGKLHREYYPAYIEYNIDGSVSYKKYYILGIEIASETNK